MSDQVFMRLDKAVAHNFDIPRKLAVKYIKQGMVAVDGTVVVDPAAKIKSSSMLEADGNEVCASNGFAARVFMLNKPPGIVCADKDNLHPAVMGLFVNEPRLLSLHCVGRLDIDTTGLLLVSDDGNFCHQVTSPKREIPKIYRVSTALEIASKDIQKFAGGLKHPDEEKRYKPAVLKIVDKKEALVTVTEGRFHEVKRLFECVGNEVLELKRLAIGSLELDDSLDEGEYRLLSDDEIALVFS